ncbi:hypothetical protein [Nostoc commune]|nr:hypothetical protein [Nostoc commune]
MILISDRFHLYDYFGGAIAILSSIGLTQELRNNEPQRRRVHGEIRV